MAFDAFVEAGPHCAGDPIIINFCNCPPENWLVIRINSPLPAPAVTYTLIDDGVQIDGAAVGNYQFELKCCDRFEQDSNNPFFELYIPIASTG